MFKCGKKLALLFSIVNDQIVSIKYYFFNNRERQQITVNLCIFHTCLFSPQYLARI